MDAYRNETRHISNPKVDSQKIYLCVLVLTLMATVVCAVEVNNLEVPDDEYNGNVNEAQVEYTQVVYSSHAATEDDIGYVPGETVHEKITYTYYTDGSCTATAVDLSSY